MDKKIYTQTASIPFKKDISLEAMRKEMENGRKWEKIYSFNEESANRVERAFNAALAYEKNCYLKYDDPFNRPGRPIPPGETMKDFASRFGTTVEEMKQQERQVDAEIERTNFKLKRKGNG